MTVVFSHVVFQGGRIDVPYYEDDRIRLPWDWNYLFSCDGFLGDFTVAFLGTSDGHLKKTVVESASSGIEYADIPIAPGTIYLEK